MAKIDVVVGDFLIDNFTKVVSGYIPLKQLINLKVIDSYDPEDRNSGGYQRMVQMNRVNKLVSVLASSQVDVPTAVLGNIRDFNPADLKGKSSNIAELDLKNKKINIVDGQHRVAAYELLLEEDSERWEKKLIPIILVLGATQDKERAFFHEVNGNAKSISAAYLQEILAKRAEVDPEFMSQLDVKEHWKIQANEILHSLNDSKGVWRNKIKFPGSKEGTIPNSGFVNTLKPLFDDTWFGGRLDQKTRIETLKAFWQGAYLYYSEFSENPFENPSSFALQKRIGVAALHGMVIPIKEYMNEDGVSTSETQGFLDPEIWKGYLKHVLNFEDINAEGDVVTGAEFWRSGKYGGAGKYSSGAGTKDLIRRLNKSLKNGLKR